MALPNTDIHVILKTERVIGDETGTTLPAVSGIANIPHKELQENIEYLETQVTAISGGAGVPGGTATLDGGGTLTVSEIPDEAISNTFEVASQAAMLSIVGVTVGDVAVRSDESKTYKLQSGDGTSIGDWVEFLAPTDAETLQGYTSSINPPSSGNRIPRSDPATGKLKSSWVDLNAIGKVYEDLEIFNDVSSPDDTLDISLGTGIFVNDQNEPLRSAFFGTVDTTTFTASAGGLIGTLSSNKWYYLWLFTDGTLTVPALHELFGYSPVTAVAQSYGFTYVIRLGAVRVDGSGNFKKFYQRDDKVAVENTNIFTDDTSTTATSVVVTGGVPEIATEIKGVLKIEDNSGSATGEGSVFVYKNSVKQVEATSGYLNGGNGDIQKNNVEVLLEFGVGVIWHETAANTKLTFDINGWEY